MLDRKELESFGIVMTDEEWKANQKQMSELQERMWAEDHPLEE